MIPSAIIYEHAGKYVDVYTTRGTHSGILEISKNDVLCTVIVLKARDQWNADRYGSIYVDATSVIAIREIKPRVFDKDEGEDDCCETDSPKAYFKKSEDESKIVPDEVSKGSK